MPLITMLCGYFPGKRLGWLEDTPAGVVRDWSTPSALYETRPSGRLMHAESGRTALRQCQAQKHLAISITDDPYATIPAIERLLAYFIKQHKHPPADRTGKISVNKKLDISHFSAAHTDPHYGPLHVFWLQKSELSPDTPGRTVPRKSVLV